MRLFLRHQTEQNRNTGLDDQVRRVRRSGEEVMVLSKSQAILSMVLQLIAAAVLLQTLFFKFTGAEESIYIFTTLGIEPWGRIGSGIGELVASALLLYPPTAAIGATMAMGTMAVAILSHLTVLGIEVMGDGGLLFALAIVVFVCSTVVLVMRRTELPVVGRFFEVAL